MFPILNPPPSSLPIPSLWVIPVHQPQVSSIMHRTWTGDSFPIWYYTCFNAILPNLSTLSLSHRVHKTVLYISVSFAYRSFVSLGRFIPRYFILFIEMVSGIVFLISLSDFSLLVYRNARNFNINFIF